MKVSDFQHPRASASRKGQRLWGGPGGQFSDQKPAIGNRQPRRGAAAFSLVELMVASVLLMFLVLLLFTVFSHMAGSYQQTESRADSYRDGRAAIYLMGKELQALVDLGNYHTNASAAPLPPLEAVTGTNGSVAFLTRLSQASQPATNALSDICMVGYFTADNAGAANPGRSLYRCLIPSEETYTRLKATPTGFLTPDDMSPGATNAEPVADNVVNFQVKVLDPDYAEIPDPATATNAAYVELSLTVIGSRNGRLYFAADTPDAIKARLGEKDARTFVLRSKIEPQSP